MSSGLGVQSVRPGVVCGKAVVTVQPRGLRHATPPRGTDALSLSCAYAVSVPGGLLKISDDVPLVCKTRSPVRHELESGSELHD
jgi:hypothetical protein